MFWYETVFIYVTYVVYFLFIVTGIGISNYLGLSEDKAHEYLDRLDYFRQIYIGITLLLVFNPWTKTKYCTEFHKKIIFTSSIFLLLPPTVSLLKEVRNMIDIK